ncbi:MAG: DUF2955 domain-containing protein, partial [Pseudomonadota bacterium]
MADAPAPHARRGVSLSGADRLVLRLAFGATFAFAIATLLKWEFSFLAPLLAVQIIASLPTRPALGQGLAIPIVILFSTHLALAASTLLRGAPPVLLALVGVAVFWSFYGQRRGAPAILMLLVQIAVCCVPLIATISLDLAREFSDFLFKSSVTAIATVWIAHMVFPAPAAAASPPPPPALASRQAAWVALSDMVVLLPLLFTFVVGGDINNVVILMITINLLREVDLPRSVQLAVAILLANLIGGLAAVAAHQVVLVTDSLALFLLAVFLAGLVFGGRLVRGSPTAPIYALAFSPDLILLDVMLPDR